jgi:hypothetical protein
MSVLIKPTVSVILMSYKTQTQYETQNNAIVDLIFDRASKQPIIVERL